MRWVERGHEHQQRNCNSAFSFAFHKQSSQAVSKNVQPNEIAGIGFDATCSLVVLDEDGAPISVSHDKNDERNVIMW